MNLNDLHRTFGLTPVINAAGSYTPLGVSRSSADVAQRTAQALQAFFLIEELQQAASSRLSAAYGCEAAVVTHCVSAAITQSVAACIAGTDTDAVMALPDAKGRDSIVVIPEGHCVNYGHPLVTDVRLAGATVLLAGTRSSCSQEDIDRTLAQQSVCGLLLVSSRLTGFQDFDYRGAVLAARRRGLPTIIDAAAQDMRIDDLLATGADAVLVSAHKYMASPTAGLVMGSRDFVRRFRSQELGIGRAMKATKESIVGVLAALEERTALDKELWRRVQDEKVATVLQRLGGCPNLHATVQPDPVGMPFNRVQIEVQSGAAAAMGITQKLKAGSPSIWVMEHMLGQGLIVLELVSLTVEEACHVSDALISASMRH